MILGSKCDTWGNSFSFLQLVDIPWRRTAIPAEGMIDSFWVMADCES